VDDSAREACHEGDELEGVDCKSSINFGLWEREKRQLVLFLFQPFIIWHGNIYMDTGYRYTLNSRGDLGKSRRLV
jgi:hypothetical protein